MRIRLARSLLRLGAFIQSLPVVVMTPDDLVEFSRASYARSQMIESWANDAVVDSGLTCEEEDLVASVPAKTGKLLLLGVGGGREAIPLARAGFQVTGIDYVPAMVEKAKENAARRGVRIDGLVQDMAHLDVDPSAFDVVWLSSAAYSCVPTRARRVDMVRRIGRALKPGGFFLFQFHRGPGLPPSRKSQFVRRLIAACTFGNRAYEEGDVLWGNAEFLHAFTSEDQVRSELEEGGLSVVCFQTERNPVRCGAVGRKSA